MIKREQRLLVGGYFGLAARPYLGYDVVKLDLCEVFVHLLQDLTEPHHWNETLPLAVKQPEKIVNSVSQMFFSAPKRLLQLVIGEI